MEAMEAFEPLNYEEEFIRFSETVATNLEKFQRSCDDIKKIEYNAVYRLGSVLVRLGRLTYLFAI